MVNDNEPPDEPQFVTVSQEKASHRRHAGGKPRVNFNLTEALRQRSLGYGYRKIARRMNNVSRATVRRRLMEYDAQQQAQSPKPAPASEPASKPPQAPSMSAQAPKPPVVPVVAPPPEPKAAPVSKVDPVPPPPSVDAPPPEPHGLDTVPAGTKAFFLLNGANNAILARNCTQIAVGIERWHPSYASLPAFRDVDKLWVTLNSDDDNQAFLLSIVEDIWIRERCAVSRGDSLIGVVRWTWLQQVCKDRLITQRANAGLREEYWRQQFEVVHHFIPLPAPNCVREIEKLLEPRPEPEKPLPFDGGYSAPSGVYPQADNVPPQRGDRSCGFAF